MKNYFNYGLLQGYIDSSNNELHIHYFGSNQWEDWFADFFCPKIPGLNIHAGFYSYFLMAQKHLPNLENKNLLITGHSLGAAVAVLMARHLTRAGYRPVCKVAGCPRIGGFKFYRLSKDIEVQRISLAGDMVPHLPPKIMGWWHIGTETKHKINGKDQHSPSVYQQFCDFDLF